MRPPQWRSAPADLFHCLFYVTAPLEGEFFVLGNLGADEIFYGCM